MAIPATSRQAIFEAMERFDHDLRAKPEWADWEENKSHRYAIEHSGRLYPVKQVVSEATGVPVSEFSGGKGAGQANEFAKHYGFHLVRLRERNPPWARDELILALDMYLRHKGQPPGKGSAEIAALSEVLNRLGRYLGTVRGDLYRNANGVYMKLMNFRRFDPEFKAAGKVGLQRGGKEEEEVWDEFAHGPVRCHQVAETIKATLDTLGDHETAPELDEGEQEAQEGRVVTALHRRYERNRKLVQTKKQRVKAKAGKLACEVCGFDFRESYGKHGDGFIECHHDKPVHSIKPGETTKLSDLRLLCVNCHRMIHAKKPWLSVEELSSLLRL